MAFLTSLCAEFNASWNSSCQLSFPCMLPEEHRSISDLPSKATSRGSFAWKVYSQWCFSTNIGQAHVLHIVQLPRLQQGYMTYYPKLWDRWTSGGDEKPNRNKIAPRKVKRELKVLRTFQEIFTWPDHARAGWKADKSSIRGAEEGMFSILSSQLWRNAQVLWSWYWRFWGQASSFHVVTSKERVTAEGEGWKDLLWMSYQLGRSILAL